MFIWILSIPYATVGCKSWLIDAYRKESYDDKPTFLDTENREDSQLRAGLSFRWRFYEDWSTELSYQYTKNSSSSILYEYDQHLVSMNAAVFF
ncbi:MAG: surface lipoprotein assembly modifier [Deferribacteraceae bacterium]|nr:surface lipoprotein assembly modifier [Deferribacteraceae bacterium]